MGALASAIKSKLHFVLSGRFRRVPDRGFVTPPCGLDFVMDTFVKLS